MKTIYKPTTISDGRTFYYHQVYMLKYLQDPTTIEVVIGSWIEDPRTRVNPQPEYKSSIFITNENGEDFLKNLTETVAALPGWENSIIQDDSTPK